MGSGIWTTDTCLYFFSFFSGRRPDHGRDARALDAPPPRLGSDEVLRAMDAVNSRNSFSYASKICGRGWDGTIRQHARLRRGGDVTSHRRGGAGETGGRGGTRRGSVVARAKTRVRTWLMVGTSAFRPEVSRGSLPRCGARRAVGTRLLKNISNKMSTLRTDDVLEPDRDRGTRGGAPWIGGSA